MFVILPFAAIAFSVFSADTTLAVPDSVHLPPVSCVVKNGDRISGGFRGRDSAGVHLSSVALGKVLLSDSVLALCESPDTVVMKSLDGLIFTGNPYFEYLQRIDSLPLPSATSRPMAHISPLRIPSLAKQGPRPIIVPLAAAIPSSQSKVGWKRNVSVSYTVSQGNANASDLGFQGGATRRAARSQIAFTTRRILGKRNGQSSTDYLAANVRYDRALGSPNATPSPIRPSFFSEAIFEADPFAKLQSRVVSNTGISIPLSSDPKSNLALEVGLGLTHDKQQYKDGDLKASGIVRLAAKQTFGIARSDQQIATFPDYADQVVKYRINSNFNFSSPISTKLSLRIGLINRFNTRPQPGVKKSDTTIQSGLGVEF